MIMNLDIRISNSSKTLVTSSFVSKNNSSDKVDDTGLSDSIDTSIRFLMAQE